MTQFFILSFADKQDSVQNRTPISSGKDNTPVRIVRITGIKPGTSKPVLEMVVKNKSGESELESCDFDEDTGVEVVEFNSPKGNVSVTSGKKNVDAIERVWRRRTKLCPEFNNVILEKQTHLK